MNRRQLLASTASALALAEIGSAITSAQPGNPGDPMTGDDPMIAAEYLSSLESNQYIPTLYTLYGYIHPDAAEVVPRATVIGWYQQDFHPQGPQPAIATGVTYLDSWTWGVTGITYNNVAEVSFTQEFTNGDTLNDVVRLIFHDGSWRWWFGRDAAWVEEQNARFSLVENIPQAGDAPFGLSGITAIDETLLQRLPSPIQDSQFDGTYEPRPTAGSFNPDGLREPQQMFLYKMDSGPGSEFPLGEITLGAVVDSTTNAEDLIRFADQAQNAPPVEFIGWNSAPESGPAWLQTENAGVDVVGTSYAITLVLDGMYLTVRMYSEDSLGVVCEALAAG